MKESDFVAIRTRLTISSLLRKAREKCLFRRLPSRIVNSFYTGAANSVELEEPMENLDM